MNELEIKLLSEQSDLQPPPHNIYAEKVVLGGITRGNKELYSALETLPSEAFYLRKHQIIFAVYKSLYKKCESLEIENVIQMMSQNSELEKAGGAEYIRNIYPGYFFSVDADLCLKILRDLWLKRKIFNITNEINQMCCNILPNAESLLCKLDFFVSSSLSDIADNKFNFVTAKQGVEKMCKCLNKKESEGLKTGFPRLDEITNGFYGGELITIASRPGVGTTDFALEIAKNISLNENKPVAIFSMKMNARQLYSRIICSYSGIDKDRFEKGDFTKEEQVVFNESASKIKNTKIFVDDSAQLLPFDLRLRCRQIKVENPDLALIIIDYFQLIDSKEACENRNDSLNYVANTLKNIAMDLDVPVLVTSMLSRGNEIQYKPQLSQLRSSVSLEEYSDKIILLHYPGNSSERVEGEDVLKIMVVKNINGKTGSFVVKMKIRKS